MKWKKLLFLMSRYGFFIILIAILAFILLVMNRNNSLQNSRISALEETVQGMFVKQASFLLEQTDVLLETKLGIAQATDNQLDRNYQRIRNLDNVYSSLLSEMEKKTLDSLYSEVVLVDMEMEARTLFQEGRYVQASIQYATIAEAQPENRQARFYYLYSLFLTNKLDRANYRLIKEGMQVLMRNGYNRAEMNYVLDFIESEEKGL